MHPAPINRAASLPVCPVGIERLDAFQSRWNNPAATPDQRRFEVAYDHSYLRTALHWTLRCWGHGLGYICEGQRHRYASEEDARAKGAEWVRSGIIPAFQSDRS